MRGFGANAWLVGAAAAASLVSFSVALVERPDDGPTRADPQAPIQAPPAQAPTRAPTLIAVPLGDDWLPVVFSETPQRRQRIRTRLVNLANERLRGREFQQARRDRHFELHGVFPSLSVLGRRLLDEPRHLCHDQVPDQALEAADLDLARPSVAALAAIAAHLRCDRLLSSRDRPVKLDWTARHALRTYRRLHMAGGPTPLDDEVRRLLLTDSRELDFRALLRALRERVADAAGLIEDGSAGPGPALVLGRTLDGQEIRRGLQLAAAGVAEPRAAPDLIAPATEAAALTLGWSSPQAARTWFASRRQPSSGTGARAIRFSLPARALVAVPPLPAYHQPHMDLRVEIDRGEVWLAHPLAPQRAARRPVLTLYVRHQGLDVALARWPTTIGGWQPFERPDGRARLRYGESPVGPAYWRYLLAGPIWYPPRGTPVESLLTETPEGWQPNSEVIGPGYRAAYGLVALLHQERSPRAGKDRPGKDRPSKVIDRGIRTHGSPRYLSIARGNSHGCHRLYNHLALRLGGFLLQHREHVRHGAPRQRYQRVLVWQKQRLALQSDHRGYRYELTPPVPLEVRPGIVRGSRAAVARDLPLPPERVARAGRSTF